MALWSQDKYIKAMRYAAEAHHGQRVPGTDLPYLLHINLVSMEVVSAISSDQNKLDGDLAVQCAILHDVKLLNGTLLAFEDLRFRSLSGFLIGSKIC